MTERDAAPSARRTSAAGRRGRAERGSASVEYCVVTAAVLVALFLPVTEAGGQSAVEYVLDALRAFQRHTTYLLSLP